MNDTLQEKIQDTIDEIDRLVDLQNQDFYSISQCAKRAMGQENQHKSTVYDTHSISVRIMRRQEKIDAYRLGIKEASKQLELERQNALST